MVIDSWSFVNMWIYRIDVKEVWYVTVCFFWVKYDVFGYIIIGVKGFFVEIIKVE